MEDVIGIVSGILNATLFFFISLYIIIVKKNKDYSHYFFIFITLSISLSGLFGTFKYTDDYEVALHLSKISIIFLSISLYFFVLFTYYLRIGINKKIPLFLIFPLIFIITLIIGPLIEGIEPTPNTWLFILNPGYLFIFSLFLYLYFFLGLYNLIIVYRNIDRVLKVKILYFVIGALIVLIFMVIHSVVIAIWSTYLPFPDISFILSGILYFYALTK